MTIYRDTIDEIRIRCHEGIQRESNREIRISAATMERSQEPRHRSTDLE